MSSLVQILVKPKRLMIAGCVMIATLALAIAVEYLTTFQTAPFVRTVFYFLVLEYVWASVKREWLDRGF